jgi:hypothetical protein
MTYAALISRTDVKAVRDFSPNIENIRIDPYIREAHELYLANFLGADLYDEIMTEKAGNTLTAANLALINDYLKTPLCFYAYARMIEAQPVNVTRFGVVRKETEFSENLSVGDLQKLADMARKAGAAYLDKARVFLNDNAADYPLWETDGTQKTGNWGVNIRSIG